MKTLSVRMIPYRVEMRLRGGAVQTATVRAVNADVAQFKAIRKFPVLRVLSVRDARERPAPLAVAGGVL